ncbi:MAG: hypothetical protein V3U75_13600 [Methylococcaceae bacterium]
MKNLDSNTFDSNIFEENENDWGQLVSPEKEIKIINEKHKDFDNWIKPFLTEKEDTKMLEFKEAKETAEPFAQSLSDIGLQAYTPQYNEVRDDLAELIQAQHEIAYRQGFDKGIAEPWLHPNWAEKPQAENPEHELITFEIPKDQAFALAQFLKRSGFKECETNAENETEAYQMVYGLNKVREALALAGYSPR